MADRHAVTTTVRAEPQRTCVGCRTRRPQSQLVRLARTPDGVRLDPIHRLPGRGAYVCPDPACVAAASRRGAAAVRRALRGGGDEVELALAGVLAGAEARP